jgi:hypothetical protein
MRETDKPTFVVTDYYWRARLRARGSARNRGSQVVSTHGLNTQRMSAVQKVWSSYVYATMLLQHGPTAWGVRILSIREIETSISKTLFDRVSKSSRPLRRQLACN